MKTMLRIFEKDLRLLRLPLVVWLAVLAAEAAFALSGLDARVEPWGAVTTWSFGTAASVLAHLAVALVLIVGVVQADGPLSASAFWRTRPVGRASLLGAKVLFTLGVVLVPWALVDMGVLMGRGVSLADAAWVAMTLLVVLVAFSLPILSAAALASTLGETLLVIVLIVGYTFLAATGILALNRAESFASPNPEARTLAGVALAVLLGVLSLAAVYGRSKRGALAVVLLGIPASIGFVHGFRTRPSTVAQLPPSLSVVPLPTDEPVMLQVIFRSHPLERIWPMATAARVVGVPPDQRVEVNWVTARVNGGKGLENLSLPLTSGLRRPQHQSLESRTLELAGLGPTTILGAWDTIWIPGAGETSPLASTPATARVRLALVTDRVVGRVPLRSGASMCQGSVCLGIVSGGAPPHGDFILHETQPDPLLEAPSHKPWGARYMRTRYWLLNSVRGEAIVIHSVYPTYPSVPPVAFGLRISRVTVRMEWPSGPRWRDQPARAEWLKDAEVLKTEATFLAAGELTVPGFAGPAAEGVASGSSPGGDATPTH